jgi:hypothetical protein
MRIRSASDEMRRIVCEAARGHACVVLTASCDRIGFHRNGRDATLYLRNAYCRGRSSYPTRTTRATGRTLPIDTVVATPVTIAAYVVTVVVVTEITGCSASVVLTESLCGLFRNCLLMRWRCAPRCDYCCGREDEKHCRQYFERIAHRWFSCCRVLPVRPSGGAVTGERLRGLHFARCDAQHNIDDLLPPPLGG